jgi:predicted RNA-binding protein with PIN domain
MVMHLLIDGYNLIHAIELPYSESLQEKREELARRVHSYQVEKKIPITIVFDGTESQALMPDRDKHGKVEIVFTKASFTADDWLIDKATRSPEKYVVVSSDREILGAVESYGGLTLTSQEFVQKLKASQDPSKENPYLEDKEDTGPLYPKVSTRKKGRSKKLPKKERRKNNSLKNL